MLCTGRSGPNWLDRLRVSKGFPVGNGVDLEHFLNPNPNLDKDSIPEKNDQKGGNEMVVMGEKKVVKEKKIVTYSRDQKNREKENLFDMMTSVLSELFNMGDSGQFQESRNIDKKKSCRKQKNPKLCVISASASINDDDDDEGVQAMSPLPSSADNSVTEEKKIGFDSEPNNIVEKNEKLKAEISGYSRADVMIIDTSAPIWKSEKLVYRKGNVWKVREKKSKCRKVFGSRKKRKSNQLSDSENAEQKKKKKKQKISLFPSSPKGVREKRIMRSNEGSVKNDAVESWKKTQNNLSPVPGNRLWFSRSPKKPAKKGSSAFHAQRIASSRKNRLQLPTTNT